MPLKSQLPRLPDEWYQGNAFVLWTYTMERRQTGWLDDTFHARFREVLLHALVRYSLVAPVYCLMPDHLHWVGIGTKPSSDQRKATAFLRRFLTPHLGPAQWQRQPHDHVLRGEERVRGAFQSACHYVLANPERAGHVAAAAEWPFSGSLIPGYPALSPFAEDFWSRFWMVTNDKLNAGAAKSM